MKLKQIYFTVALHKSNTTGKTNASIHVVIDILFEYSFWLKSVTVSVDIIGQINVA